MRNRTSLLALAATALLLPLTLTACSSAESPAPTSSATANPMAAFNSCMRDKGVPVEDASDSSGGGIAIGRPDGVDEEQYDAAFGSCLSKIPKAPELSTEERADQTKSQTEFSRCMRAEGVSDYPDPVEGEPLGLPGPDAPQAEQDAAEKCMQARDGK